MDLEPVDYNLDSMFFVQLQLRCIIQFVDIAVYSRPDEALGVEFLEQLDPTSMIVLISAVLISVLALFAKFIKGSLKLVIIAVMLLCVLYVLRQAGII